MSALDFGNMASPSSSRKANANGITSGQVTPENLMSYMTPQVRPIFSTMTGGRFGGRSSGSPIDGTPSRMFPGDARLTSYGMDGGDPFVSTNDKVKSHTHKLSANAADFTPAQGNMHTNANMTYANATDFMQAPGNMHGNVNMLYGAPVHGFDTPIATPQHDNQGSVNPNMTASTSSGDSDLTLSAEFSTDGAMTRVVKLSGIYNEVNNVQVDETLTKQQEIGAILRGSRHKLRAGDATILRFNDIRDAEAAYKLFKLEHPGWHVEFIEPATLSKLRGDSQILSKHEGQVYLVATMPAIGAVNRVKMEDQLRKLISSHGDLYAFQKQLGTEAGTIKFVAEFCDIEAAKFAVDRLNGTTAKGMHLEVGYIIPDIAAQQKAVPFTPIRPMAPEDDELTGSMARMAINGVNNGQVHSSGFAVLSPTTRTFLNTVAPVVTPQYQLVNTPYGGASSYGYPATPVAYYTPSPAAYINPYAQINGGGAFASSYIDRQMAPGAMRAMVPFTCPTPYTGRGGYGAYNPSMTPIHGVVRRRQMRPSHGDGNASHNVVDLEKIRRGLDVRTTIMLRNIPNKIDQVMLKQIVDESSFGLYDFMYLRIDFANNCNVGYAFINFEDPYHIIDFVKARAGQRWNKFNSDKIAEVSYATIQGKDCLVQKFRNSSVMLEHQSFRPKIFYTQGHPLVGQEEEFAGPDNPSKMRRSVENAEHVGLFAPRAGQHYRDEQRRRKSKYDRGTRLAEMEENEYEYEGAFEHYQSPYPVYPQTPAGYPMTYGHN